jgi:glutamate-ammonia-ligase adenylyltransferase
MRAGDPQTFGLSKGDAGTIAMPEDRDQSLSLRIVTPPLRAERALRRVEEFRNAVAARWGALASCLDDARVRDLLARVFDASPYLTGLIERDPEGLLSALRQSPEQRFGELTRELAAGMAAAEGLAGAMRPLRAFKGAIGLLTALSDLAGVWSVMTVAERLSDAADAAVAEAVSFLFRQAAARGQCPAADPSGYIVLGMGKFGARELNYSSDIDLIVFYDKARLNLDQGCELQHFCVRLTRDLVRLLSERTGDGYVFRTDLRLRPDPGATALALSTEAALQYYESFGQNWERAALIKARPVAGDIAAGEALLKSLAPFIWRKYLDFAAIADIHAMKRQIHAVRGFGRVAVAGHDIKLGRGGIREIEFFAQTQQLIAGGRQPDLRKPDTLAALAALERRGWITAEVRRDLDEAYRLLRCVEHRLQMIADEQTQKLPGDPAKLENLARFCGFSGTNAFTVALTGALQRVQAHYLRLFEQSSALTSGGANMVFAGESDDPETLKALREMGFTRPSDVLAAIRAWHHGRYPAVRSERARALLTEVQPLVMEALAHTVDPDAAFIAFDHFLSALPSGLQLFSLLKQNPGLLELIAAIVGTAPRLARILSRRPRVLDAVLDPGFFGSLPDTGNLGAMIEAELSEAHDFQQLLDRARLFVNEQAFLIGVRVLTGTIGAADAGGAYALLAEHVVAAMQNAVEAEMVRAHGRVPGGGAAVLAMGKLGGREMTATSDLDLIVVYDFDPAVALSDGARPLAPLHYYTRFTQRLISALTAPTAEGRLYDVDMRLRPSGNKGPVATQLSSFIAYQHAEAWTWEHLALTRARIISGPAGLRRTLERAIGDVLRRPRDRRRIAADVRDMRQRIAREKGSEERWDLKHVEGGLVDVEFIAQYLQLVHADRHGDVLDPNTEIALGKLARAGALAAPAAEALLAAVRLNHALTQVLRLCLDGAFEPARAPDGLKLLLARSGGAPDFARLELDVAERQACVVRLFEELVT